MQNIASEFIDYSAQINNISKVKSAISDSEIVFLAIDRAEIEAKEFSGFIKLKKWLTSSDQMIKDNRGKFIITVFGYDQDSRELFQIEEVRSWFQGINPIFKMWGYFLHMDEPIEKYSGISVLHNC